MKPSSAILRKASALLLRIAPTLDDGADERAARDMAERLAPRRRTKKVLPFKPRAQKKKEKRLSWKGWRAEVRAACVLRASGHCECGCGSVILQSFGELTAEWDEFYGRKCVSVEETWMLARACHRAKTENDPDRETWDEKFKAHCARHGYRFRRRFYRQPARRRFR